MSNNMAGRRKKTTQNQNKNADLIVTKVSVLFIAMVVYLIALLLLKKNGSSLENRFVMRALPYVKAVTGVLLAAAAVFFCVNRKKNVDESSWLFNTKDLVLIAFVLFVSAMLYSFVGNIGIVGGTIGLFILFMVYSFYQRDFFLYSVFSAIGTLGLLAARTGYSVSPVKMIAMIILIALAFIVPILTFLAVFSASKNNGVLKLGSKKIALLQPKSPVATFYVGSVVLLICAALSLLVSSLAFYCILAFLGLYLIVGIVYTVRLM